jgi:NTP pyrophosphatase (non-canonical NTP hydrolase)
MYIYIKGKIMDKVWNLTKQWHKDRKITINGNSLTQTVKLGEEFGELCSAIVRGNKELIKDSIGDMLVVLTAIAELENLDLKECWYSAYEEIKDRKGVLASNGNFIKENDMKCKNCKYFNEGYCNFWFDEVNENKKCKNWRSK